MPWPRSSPRCALWIRSGAPAASPASAQGRLSHPCVEASILCDTQLAHPKTVNLRDRLISPERDARKLFTFLTRPGMPPTNNHAELALRGPVLVRKTSFGSRSEAGAHAFAVLASILGTARPPGRFP